MIYFARHGQTDADKQNRFNGGIDLDLNETGIEQAQKLKDKLSGIQFDAVFCSPQKRAVQTCEIATGKYVIDNRLTELNCGNFDGKKRNAISKLRFLISLKRGKNGVERLELFTARNVEFCEKVLRGLTGNVLIVSHHGNASAFDFYFKGKPKKYNFTKRIVENGELLTFEF